MRDGWGPLRVMSLLGIILGSSTEEGGLDRAVSLIHPVSVTPAEAGAQVDPSTDRSQAFVTWMGGSRLSPG
jgi:hypothetical protein